MRIPVLAIVMVIVLPLEMVNCDDDSCERHSNLPDAPPDTLEMTANFTLLIAPPVPVQTTSAASNMYWPAEAPTVHTIDASDLPDEL